jgi:uncharacterized protein YndB with AHSA1/START domain
MKDFDWSQFTRSIAVKSSMATLYNAWTKSEEIEKWFLEHSIFSDPHNKPILPSKRIEKGDRYEWKWYAQEWIERGEILEANGKDQLEFTFEKSKVTVKLKEVKDHVIVELTQKDIPLDDDSKRNIRLGCATGWSFFLVNLKSVYEGGLDLRNKDADFIKMINN